MVVFDMAGTTVDEQNVVYKTLHAALREAGLDVSLQEVLTHCAGKEKLMAIADLLEAHGLPEKTADTYAWFMARLAAAYESLDVKPQEGAVEIFAYLRSMDVKVVLNTGYDQKTAEHLLRKLDWQVGREIDALVTASHVAMARPWPDMIDLVMEQFGFDDPTDVCKIGDSVIDIEEGRNAGCGLVLGILTGAHNHTQLSYAEPDGILTSLWDLREWI